MSLEDNASLSDIQALLDNVGLGSGDRVRLRGTSVGCADVQTLVDAGVDVVSDC